MPETSTAGQAANPSTVARPPSSQRGRPPGEMGGHTVMPWEQGEGGQASSHVPAGGDAASPASGGSSKSVPPPSTGAGRDGLGQGAGESTAKAADGMTPPASESLGVAPPQPVSAKPPEGSAGAPAKPNFASRPQETQLPAEHPEGMERKAGLPQAGTVGQDAPADAMAGAPPTAQKATPQATRQSPEDQIRGGDATRTAATVGVDTLRDKTERAPPAGVDATAKASAPKPSPMLPSTGVDAAKAASGAALHPTNPAAQARSDQHDPAEDALVAAIDKHLAEMLARALHETVATAVREARAASRPPAPPPVQPAPPAQR